jgi:hypothetical protein
MGLDLTDTQKNIIGMFWLPNQEDRKFRGELRRKAGKSATLDTAFFEGDSSPDSILNPPPPEDGKPVKLTGDEFYKAMFPRSLKFIHGRDEHGHPITLYKCHSAGSSSTLTMSKNRYDCQAAFFGVHLDEADMRFRGIRLHLDYLDSWVGRRALGDYREEWLTDENGRRPSHIHIPIAPSFSIPLSLPGYASSEFFCAWGIHTKETEFRLSSRVYLDLVFESPRDWDDVMDEVHRWQWLLSLATRRAVDVREFAVYRDDVRVPIGEKNMKPCDVWIRRDHSRNAPDYNRAGIDFHFNYSAVESIFPALIEKWNQMHQPWAAVLHRFFAVSHRRGLWINEEFLFLAQAVEALYRARTGDTDNKNVTNKAAVEAYDHASAYLKGVLGKKGKFADVFRKTRNYWTHYGEPSPSTDPEVLGDLDLLDFSEKLRWIVESAIIQELGAPDHCVSKVWSGQWKGRLVTYD